MLLVWYFTGIRQRVANAQFTSDPPYGYARASALSSAHAASFNLHVLKGTGQGCVQLLIYWTMQHNRFLWKSGVGNDMCHGITVHQTNLVMQWNLNRGHDTVDTRYDTVDTCHDTEL